MEIRAFSKNVFVAASSLALFSFLISSCNTKQTNYAPEIQTLKTDLENLRSKQTDLETEIILLKAQDENFVNISYNGIQDIGDTFSVSNLEATKHLSGLKITGRMVNRDSVTYESLSFQAKVNAHNQVANFSISKISPGSSTTFSFYLPNIPDNTQYIALKQHDTFVRYGSY